MPTSLRSSSSPTLSYEDSPYTTITIASAKMDSPDGGDTASSAVTTLRKAIDERSRTNQEQDNNVRAKLEAFARTFEEKIQRLKTEITDLKAQLVRSSFRPWSRDAR